MREAVETKAVEEQPVANRFTPDAQERVARLRAVGNGFADDPEPRPLSPADIRLARGTTVAALEKAAVLAEAASPQIAVVEVGELREVIAFELAYGSVRDAALTLARHVDMAILRRKLKAVKTARGLYRVAKGYVTLDAGDAVRTHVTELKRTLTRRRRKPAPVAAAPPQKT